MGRWFAEEEAALDELRTVLKSELAGAAQFPGYTSPTLLRKRLSS